MAEHLAELCSCPGVLWQVELLSNEIGYLAEEIPKQNIEDAAWVLIASSKMQEERDELKKEVLSKKESRLEDLEDSQLLQIFKKSIFN